MPSSRVVQRPCDPRFSLTPSFGTLWVVQVLDPLPPAPWEADLWTRGQAGGGQERWREVGGLH